MKTLIKTTLVVAFLVFANTLYALKFSDNLKVELYHSSANNAMVEISTFAKSNFKVTFVDSKDRIVFSDENPEPIENYRVEYNYSALGDGVYKLAVVSNDYTTERTFRKKGDEIKVGKSKTMLKPFFGYKDGVLKCTYLNIPKEYVTLYFMKKNQLLYSKDLGKVFSMSEAVNLTKLEPGSYEAILSTGNKEYSYTIFKR